MRTYTGEPENMTDVHGICFTEFRKITTTWAFQMPHAFKVDTIEGTMVGKAGDWLAVGFEGERYIIEERIFSNTFKKVGGC